MKIGSGTKKAARQPDLFSIHELVAEKGSQGAVVYAQDACLSREANDPPSLLEALAGRSGRRIVDAASATLTREIEGGAEVGYSYSAWCLAGLPHRERAPGEDWLIKTDYAQLLVRPGIRVRDDDTREPLAVPTGTLARLLLIDWQSEAYERGRREIALGKNPNALLTRLGLSRGGPVTRKLADQLERLSTCTIDFRFGSDRAAVVVNERLVEAFAYTGGEDPRTRRHARWIERIVLSEAFYRELRRHPVLVNRAAIRDIQTSPRAIDVYLWLAFRLHALDGEAMVSWTALWRQFGREFRTLKSFKAEFQEPLALALAVYRAARVRVMDRGLLLAPSPPPIRH
ncbi:MAG: plasmid replication protein [Acetobacteraceae bacterium]|nr:plasmid replication protein [Acetobacteraceae bacterium]MBV8574365.1 plasmid replication protein [Acetobacteraceae bacterium]